ncbi:MAG: PEGA domain-containing protein [Acidobacteriales bacterium]|nr:PEGA domain-containing protein [Terriglobales bacterium]
MGTTVEKIGRYEIIGELGKGAMGVVYKALDPTIGRTVALKTMRLDVHGLEAEEMLMRFRNEARAAGVLNHPNIITIYDAGETEGLFYMAMQFIQGQTLHRVLMDRRVLPPDEILDVSRQVCAGLDAAHARKVIHRDIKPANIMIEPDGTAKVMDFGIAKAGGGMTSAGQVLGTPNYMSPEQVKGKELDGRSDLFSYGVILYEIVTGEKPFTGQNVTTIIYKIINENPIPPCELDVTIHPGLSGVIVKALAKNPDDRFQTGAELVRHLEQYKRFQSTDDSTTRISSGAYHFSDAVTQNMRPAALGQASARSKTAAAAAPAPLATQASVSTKKAIKSPAVDPPLVEPGFNETIEPESVGTLHRSLTRTFYVFVVFILAILLLGGIYVRRRAARIQATTAPTVLPPAPAEEMPQYPLTFDPAETENEAPGRASKPPATGNGQSSKPNAMGELALTSSPSGAQIQIDGRGEPNWKTPFTASALVAGPHNVTFKKQGYATETRIVEVASGQKGFVSAQLRPTTARLAISSDPEGAEIILDGKNIGKVTPVQLTVDQGQHTLSLRKDGYRDLATSVNLRPGELFTYSPILKAADSDRMAQKLRGIFVGNNANERVMVHVRTNPKGAVLLINGYPAPRTTPLRVPLSPGKYEIELQMDGYRSVRRVINLDRGVSLDIDEVLEKR